MTELIDDEIVATLLPAKMMELLRSCPKAGGGVNLWIYNAALRLHNYIADKECIARLLEQYSGNCGRELQDDEIWRAIENSEAWLEQQKGKPFIAKPTSRWPEPNKEQIEAITKAGPNLAGLEDSSPKRWNDGLHHTEEIIDVLFPGNPLICAASKKECAKTRTREEWRGVLFKQQFIVPSPMTARHGKTKQGQDSMRCLANTGPRRFQVVEFDQGDFDQHAALLMHLSKSAPLVLVVHSGNKSLHGWFFCANEPTEKVEEFFRGAVALGADRATWTRCQLVRMPDGLRDNDKLQRVVYFNPAIMEGK